MSNLLQKKQLLPTKHESNPPATLHALLVAILVCLTVSAAAAQTAPASPAPAPGFDSLAHPPAVITPLTQPTLSPGIVLLMELDGRFAQAVAAGGGKAFASWFADDAVTLNNGRPAVFGHNAIAAQAQWDPKTYQLTWVPQGGQMGPSNDMGFTWGHYEGRSIDKNGQPVVTSGRYITMWKKLSDGSWKVAMDASADDAAPSECCTLPKP
jgi:ketosteroid isomerase-like protein